MEDFPIFNLLFLAFFSPLLCDDRWWTWDGQEDDGQQLQHLLHSGTNHRDGFLLVSFRITSVHGNAGLRGRENRNNAAPEAFSGSPGRNPRIACR